MHNTPLRNALALVALVGSLVFLMACGHTSTGTGNVNAADTYHTANGNVSWFSAADQLSVAALVPQADGSVKILPGEGDMNGTYTIPDLPANYYWLQVYPGELYWTDSSSFDFGTDYIGRPGLSVASYAFSVNLTGLDASTDDATLASPNANAQTVFGCYYTSTCTLTESGWVTPIDSSQGDTSYVYQMVPSSNPTFPAMVMGPVLSLPSLTVNLSGTTNLSGALTTAAVSQNLDINFQGSAWGQMFSKVGPAPATNNKFQASLFVQPIMTSGAVLEYYTGEPDGVVLPLIQGSTTTTNTSQDFGSIQYNNPFPSTWPVVFGAYETASVAIPAPGSSATVSMTVVNGYETTSIPTGSISPLMGPVQNPQMNGASLFTAATSNTRLVTLSWTPPSGHSAYGYDVTIYQIVSPPGGASPYAIGIADLFTAQNSVTTPPTLLLAGGAYLFNIRAMADGNANMVSSPWHSGYPRAAADVISAPLTISSSAPAVVAHGDVSILAAKPGEQAYTRSQRLKLMRNHAAGQDASQRPTNSQ